MAGTTRIVIDTASGPAWIDLDRPIGRPGLVLALGHGAGGSVEAPDLLSVRDHCVAAGFVVARVTQPYRVAGKKAPPAGPRLDEAFAEVMAGLTRQRGLTRLPVVVAGRSSGARVACRVAATAQARPPIGVVALAFPVHPPGRPAQSRQAELDAVAVPTLVVQGAADPFGMPEPADGRTIEVVPGDHSLKRSADEVGRLVARWLVALAG